MRRSAEVIPANAGSSGRGRRYPAGWVGALTVLLVLAGCATVPTSGPVEHHTPQANAVNPGVQVDPLPPAPGASRMLVVEGFLHAMGVYQPDYSVARQYLTESANQSWRPESGVQVYSDGFPPSEFDQTVVLSAPEIGRIDSTGRYQSSTGGPLRHDFGLVEDSAGEWRISRPPEGLLVSRYLFTTSYIAVNLHFTDSAAISLVPDPRFFAAGDQALAAAIRAQLAGPSVWLAPAVRRLDTDSITVGTVALDSGGILDIPLGGDANQLSADQRQILLSELAYTMTGFAQVSSIRVSGSGQSWPGELGQAEVDRDSYLVLSPTNVSAPRVLFAFREGRLQRLRGANTWTDPTAVEIGLQSAEQFAVRSDLAEVAAVTGDGTRLETAEIGAPGRPRPVRSGTGLLRPDYARNGELWSPAAARVSALRVFSGDSSVTLDTSDLPDRPVVAAKLSPDGARLALVLERGDATGVGIALVQRDEDRIVLSDWSQVEINLTAGLTGSAIDIGWDSGTVLAVLQETAGGDVSVIKVSQDGASATDVGPSEADALVQLAVVPGRDAVALASGGAAYRFDGEFSWRLALSAVDTLAYSG